MRCLVQFQASRRRSHDPHQDFRDKSTSILATIELSRQALRDRIRQRSRKPARCEVLIKLRLVDDDYFHFLNGSCTEIQTRPSGHQNRKDRCRHRRRAWTSRGVNAFHAAF